jgi:hypothetical protein
MKWHDLKIELLNEYGVWVPIVSAKPNENLIAWDKKGVFVWHHIEDTEVRCKAKSTTLNEVVQSDESVTIPKFLKDVMKKRFSNLIFFNHKK